MPTLELAAGSLRVRYPESYRVEAGLPAKVVRRDKPSDTLLDAFAGQDLDLVERLELVPVSPAFGTGHHREPANQTDRVHLTLDLDPQEDAVLLLEQDGFLSWRLPTGHERRHPPPPSSGTAGTDQHGAGPSQARLATFEIDVPLAEPTRAGAGVRTTRSPAGDVLGGRLTAYVLRFASWLVPGAIMTFLERDTRPGLLLMTGDDVLGWRRVDDLSQVALPQSRPAKILLFVHGTFSNTVGNFGVLTTTAHGLDLLEAAGGAYDAVIGFDHRTLSRDPLENATDLHTRLDAGHLAFTPTIDLVTYSRGALVARSLIEYLLPSSTRSSSQANIGTVVFVGGTNAGTPLAEPENWKDFLDLYTNLAAATARSIGSGTRKASVRAIVEGLVKGLGAFVKYLVSGSVTREIPGLAAMEPDGPFIRGINSTQPGQPGAGTPWYVVSSDFEVMAEDAPDGPDGLASGLLARLADGLADRLMGTENDLVVDTASMSSVDLPSGGGFIKGTLGFGTNDVVHHLNYLIQPEVCDALKGWLTGTTTQTT